MAFDKKISGGYFKANLKFPKEYPMKPPKMKFTSKIWHPNVHDNGEVSYFSFYNCRDKKIFQRSAFLFFTIQVMINMDMKKHLSDGYQSIP